jgi:hypothetical protein
MMLIKNLNVYGQIDEMPFELGGLSMLITTFLESRRYAGNIEVIGQNTPIKNNT